MHWQALYRHGMASISSRSAPAAHPDIVAVEIQPDCTKQQWWELLSCISSPTATSGHQARDSMVQLLSQAENIVNADKVWSSSGVRQLLQRALALAQKGQLLGAQRTVLNAVDFATAYTKISDRKTTSSLEVEATGPGGTKDDGSHKCSIASAHQPSGERGSSSSTSSDVTSSGITPAASLPTTIPHAHTALSANTGVLLAATVPNNTVVPPAATQEHHNSVTAHMQPGDMPSPPSKRQKLTHDKSDTGLITVNMSMMPPPPQVPGKQQQQQQQQQQRGSTDCLQEWCGQLSLVDEAGGRVSELCNVTLQLPSNIAGSMPPMLNFTHLVQRRGVTLGQHQAVRTTINKANARQLTRLRSMAQHELVAVQALSQRSHIIFVPYTDKQAQLKSVCFYLQA